MVLVTATLQKDLLEILLVIFWSLKAWHFPNDIANVFSEWPSFPYFHTRSDTSWFLEHQLMIPWPLSNVRYSWLGPFSDSAMTSKFLNVSRAKRKKKKKFFLGFLVKLWEKRDCRALYLFLRLWLNVVLVAELPFPPSFSFIWSHTCYWHLATALEEVMFPSSDSSLWHIQLWSDPSYLFNVSLFPYLLSVSIRLVSFNCPTNTVIISGFCWCSFPPAKPFFLFFSPIQIPLARQSPNRIYFFF